ncbi:AraC family transcriptional regulator [Stutzerimonas stutzeri]|uniref:AraC family transcriptional regulator n=1 Tax=Stutzerimonas stutzeri TaxID=316 RepID=W8R7H4_STUST|nr:helix-turn-helix domain-containing protein [Stutzerimonas stutzeri]AHL75508.1 AraC family transcriptional regulator [Stutzerimonas stutzeri]MCQ4327922.1 helix-turn-helix transcriptional regulator [Stutzerimonas stutzeri]
MNTATLDTETYHLALSLHAVLESDERSDPDTLCQVGRRLCQHLLERYQTQASVSQERIALAPWQERKAKEILAGSVHAKLFIADVAEQCAMSRSHFSRAFKKATGMSPQDWSLQWRVRRAQELLADGSLSLCRISLECGFADQSHFSRMFSKLVGTTPKRWQREQLQLNND